MGPANLKEALAPPARASVDGKEDEVFPFITRALRERLQSFILQKPSPGAARRTKVAPGDATFGLCIQKRRRISHGGPSAAEPQPKGGWPRAKVPHGLIEAVDAQPNGRMTRPLPPKSPQHNNHSGDSSTEQFALESLESTGEGVSSVERCPALGSMQATVPSVLSVPHAENHGNLSGTSFFRIRSKHGRELALRPYRQKHRRLAVFGFGAALAQG